MWRPIPATAVKAGPRPGPTLVLGSNSELRAVVEVYADPDIKEKFVRHCVKASADNFSDVKSVTFRQRMGVSVQNPRLAVGGWAVDIAGRGALVFGRL